VQIDSVHRKINSDEITDFNSGFAVCGSDPNLILADGKTSAGCALDHSYSHNLRRALAIPRISHNLFKILLKFEVVKITRKKNAPHSREYRENSYSRQHPCALHLRVSS
jgi:hypothetical protein